MRLGVLFSGGKDSVLALHRAAEDEEVACLVTVVPDNPESYLFHTPNLHIVDLQARATGLPVVRQPSEGVEEEELEDLGIALERARAEHGIEGVVTGAVASVYQATRVQRVSAELGLWCFNPLWQMDQMDLLQELLDRRFEVVVSGVYAPPLDADWLGRRLDHRALRELEVLWRSHGINPAGEGGELETTVLDAPMFRRRVELVKGRREWGRDSGTLVIEEARLVVK